HNRAQGVAQIGPTSAGMPLCRPAGQEGLFGNDQQVRANFRGTVRVGGPYLPLFARLPFSFPRQSRNSAAQGSCCVDDTGPQPAEPLVLEGHQTPGPDGPNGREATPFRQPGGPTARGGGGN